MHSADTISVSQPCPQGQVTFKGRCPRLRSGFRVFIRTAKDAAKAEKDATKDAANAQKDATKDAAKAQKDAVKDAKVKKDKDRDPSASTNKTKGKHLAKGHSH